jgi:hypothetical protein
VRGGIIPPKTPTIHIGREMEGEEENRKVATLVEGAHTNKLSFGANARTNEGKGSKEKK